MRRTLDFDIETPNGLNLGDTVFELTDLDPQVADMAYPLELRGGIVLPIYGDGQFAPFGYEHPSAPGVIVSAFTDGTKLKIRIGSSALKPASRVVGRLVYWKA